MPDWTPAGFDRAPEHPPLLAPVGRRRFDFYPSDAYQVRALLHHVPEIAGLVLECCCGDGAISSILTGEAGLSVVSNDVHLERRADYHLDASLPASWWRFPAVDWVVSNIPFAGHLCLPIVRLALAHAGVGVALQVRLSFFEPTPKAQGARRLTSAVVVPASEPRGPWLRDHPVNRLLVLPRHSFTGDGKHNGLGRVGTGATGWCTCHRAPRCGAAVC